MDLQDLRKYAITRRFEIRFGECLLDPKGQVKIPGEEKDFRIEDAFDAADRFVIIENGNSRSLTREEMAKALAHSAEKTTRSHSEVDDD